MTVASKNIAAAELMMTFTQLNLHVPIAFAYNKVTFIPKVNHLKANIPTHDEITALRDIVLLHLCLQTLEHRRMRAFADKEQEHTDRIIEAVTRDFISLKKQLKEKDIRVLFESNLDTGHVLEFPFICRGYQDKMFVFKDNYRAEIKERLKGYKG